MKTLTIQHFSDGLNTLVHPTQIQDTELQDVSNMVVHPQTVTGTAPVSSHLALTARGGYLALGDALPFVGKNLIEFQQTAVGSTPGTEKFYEVVDESNASPNDADYIYNTTNSGSREIVFTYTPAFTSTATTGDGRIDIGIRFRMKTSIGETISVTPILKIGGITYYPQPGDGLFLDGPTTVTSSIFTSYFIRIRWNPAGGGGFLWQDSDVNGTGSKPLQGFGLRINRTGPYTGTISQISLIANEYTGSDWNGTLTAEERVPTADDFNNQVGSWTKVGGDQTVTQTSDTRYLVTGGYKASTGMFQTRYLQEGATTTTLIKETASKQTDLVQLVPYLQYLVYGDGNVAARVWDGYTDAALTMTKVFKCMAKHNQRMFYGNNLTDKFHNRLYYSDAGAATPDVFDTIAGNPSTQYFNIGDQLDPIIGLQDQQDRLIIFKQGSTWLLNMTPDPVQSVVECMDDSKGILTPIGFSRVSRAIAVLTAFAGLQEIPPSMYYSRTNYTPMFPEILNQLRNSAADTLASIGVGQDQLLVSTYSNDGLNGSTARVWMLDMLSKKAFKAALKISAFCKNQGTLIFNNGLKAILDNGDGTSRIIELDHYTDSTESSIACYARTKDLTFDMPDHKKMMSYIIVEWISPEDKPTLSVDVYADGSVSETVTFAPTVAGWQRSYLPLQMPISRGNRLSFKLSAAQTKQVTRLAFLKLLIAYDVEARTD